MTNPVQTIEKPSLGKFKVRYRNVKRQFKTLVGECFPSNHGDNHILMVLDENQNPEEPNLVKGKPNYRTLLINRCLNVKAQ